jgi:hypothetical protein
MHCTHTPHTIPYTLHTVQVSVTCLGDLLEHCIHEGDVQTAAVVVMVVTIANDQSKQKAGGDATGTAVADMSASDSVMGILEGVVEEQRGRQWLLSYIDLLQRFQLFSQAAEVMGAINSMSAINSMNAINSMSTSLPTLPSLPSLPTLSTLHSVSTLHPLSPPSQHSLSLPSPPSRL